VDERFVGAASAEPVDAAPGGLERAYGRRVQHGPQALPELRPSSGDQPGVQGRRFTYLGHRLSDDGADQLADVDLAWRRLRRRYRRWLALCRRASE
jgi:hypothetical protein